MRTRAAKNVGDLEITPEKREESDRQEKKTAGPLQPAARDRSSAEPSDNPEDKRDAQSPPDKGSVRPAPENTDRGVIGKDEDRHGKDRDKKKKGYSDRVSARDRIHLFHFPSPCRFFPKNLRRHAKHITIFPDFHGPRIFRARIIFRRKFFFELAIDFAFSGAKIPPARFGSLIFFGVFLQKFFRASKPPELRSGFRTVQRHGTEQRLN
jgi:hypothetical protein